MENTYATELRQALGVETIIDTCQARFTIFKRKRSLHTPNELDTLRAIKLFLHHEVKIIRKITKRSVLTNYDCLTLSIIACLLAANAGHVVHIGTPTPLYRRYHSFIIMSSGEMFKVAGKSRGYGITPMKVRNVINRLRLFNKIIGPIELLKRKMNC